MRQPYRALKAPLLGEEEERCRHDVPATGHKVVICGGGGDGGGDLGETLRMVYTAHNEEEFQREMEAEREREIIETANKVRMVNEVFAEVGNLVAEQQSDVDQIQTQVGDATEKTKSGVNQIDKSIGHQRGLNKCYLYALIFFVVLAISLAIAVFNKDISQALRSISNDDDDDDDDDDGGGGVGGTDDEGNRVAVEEAGESPVDGDALSERVLHFRGVARSRLGQVLVKDISRTVRLGASFHRLMEAAHRR